MIIDSGYAFLAGIPHEDDVSFSVHHIRDHKIYPTAGGFNVDQLVKVVPARFLHCDATIL